MSTSGHGLFDINNQKQETSVICFGLQNGSVHHVEVSAAEKNRLLWIGAGKPRFGGHFCVFDSGAYAGAINVPRLNFIEVDDAATVPQGSIMNTPMNGVVRVWFKGAINAVDYFAAPDPHGVGSHTRWDDCPLAQLFVDLDEYGSPADGAAGSVNTLTMKLRSGEVVRLDPTQIDMIIMDRRLMAKSIDDDDEPVTAEQIRSAAATIAAAASAA